MLMNTWKKYGKYIVNDMEKIQEILLHLVKIGLGNEKDYKLPEDVDWKALISYSFKEGVPAIACDGMQVLYDNDESMQEWGVGEAGKKDIRYEWIGYQLTCERYNERYQDVLAELAKFYNENGYKILLLKGYGLCLNYPIPNHRPTGDIDCYLYGKTFEADEKFAKKYGVEIDHSSAHHSKFTFRGVIVENHFALMDLDKHWTNRKLEKVFEKFLKEEPIEGEVHGQRVYFPSHTFNAVYLIRHAGEHFAMEKITMRHVLDWGLFVKRYGKEVDWEKVYDLAERYGGTVFMNSLNAICVKYLGFDSSAFVALDNSPMVERVLDDVLCPKDMIAPHGRLKYAIWITRRVWRTRWKFNIVYNENIMSFMTEAAIQKLKEWFGKN